MKTRIELEDNGQDFLSFIVDENCVIIETQPFQGKIWNGSYIPIESEMCEVGKPCPIHNNTIKFGFLKHKIAKIEKI